jgi:hypothetical protein
MGGGSWNLDEEGLEIKGGSQVHNKGTTKTETNQVFFFMKEKKKNVFFVRLRTFVPSL